MLHGTDKSHSTWHLWFSHQCWVLTHSCGLAVFPVLSMFPCSCSRLRNGSPSLCPHSVKWWKSWPRDALCNRNTKRFKKQLGEKVLKRATEDREATTSSMASLWLWLVARKFYTRGCSRSTCLFWSKLAPELGHVSDELFFWSYIVIFVLTVNLLFLFSRPRETLTFYIFSQFSFFQFWPTVLLLENGKNLLWLEILLKQINKQSASTPQNTASFRLGRL